MCTSTHSQCILSFSLILVGHAVFRYPKLVHKIFCMALWYYRTLAVHNHLPVLNTDSFRWCWQPQWVYHVCPLESPLHRQLQSQIEILTLIEIRIVRLMEYVLNSLFVTWDGVISVSGQVAFPQESSDPWGTDLVESLSNRWLISVEALTLMIT